ncbi:glycosyl hydrolase family 18 protein [Paenibacillus sp. T3-5-0-4]|nr:glycosyl hydrolase family 18 protein [Paenibacillus endoradicis]
MMFLSFALLIGMLSNTVVVYANEPAVAAAGLEPPQNLRVVEGSITHNSVQLEWDLVGDDKAPNDIQIYHADGKWAAWGNRTTKSVGGLEPETTYSFYIVWESDKTVEGHTNVKSNVIEVTTLADTSEYKEAPLAAPLNFQVTDLTESTVTVKWIGSPGATAYDLYANGWWIGGVDAGPNQITYTLKPEHVVAGAETAFYVSAQKPPEKSGDPIITSAPSNTIKLKWGELSAPQDVQVVTSNLTTAALGWAPVAGATNYKIYQNDKLIGSSSENRFTATGLQEGESYSFTVEASNHLWQSAASEAAVVVPGANFTNVTYYAAWSVYDRDFQPDEMDVSKITHVNYSFADICWKKFGTGTTACESEDIPLQDRYVYDGEIVLGDQKKDIENLQAITDLKSINPNFKLLVSVGGWSWSKNFSNMAADEVTLRTFAKSAVDVIREYKLDGLDIDWEYPVEGGETYNSRSPKDKENFTLLMQTVRSALDAAGSEDNRYYLLTIASGQGDNFVVNADLANSSDYLDFINIMTYDYSGGWENIANHNAPLYYDPNLPKPNAERNNVLGGVNGHLTGGVPEHKLVLGLPFYGKAWSGCETPGQYVDCTSFPAGSWESGIYDYSEIISFIGKDGYVRYWNDAAKVAYLYSPEQQTFITYNDLTSMIYSSSLVKSKNLAGVMSWEVTGDRTGELLTQLNKDLPINGVTNENALAAPKGIALSSANYKTLTIKWDSVAGATGYEAYIDGRYVGSTEETQFTFDKLKSSSTYKVHVLAVSKEEQGITAVSAFSDVLNARTLTASSGGDGGGDAVSPPSNQQELTTTVVKQEDTWTVTVDKDAAVAAIKASASHTFTLTVDKAAPSVDVNLPKEVAAALVAAGVDAELILNWNGVSYVFPAKVLDHATDIRISLNVKDQQSVGSTVTPGMSAQSRAIGLTVEALGADGAYYAVSQLDGAKLIIMLPASSIEEAQVRGIVYLPDSNTFRPVATKVVKQADGSLKVELDAPTGGIYMVVGTSFNYTDTNISWAKDAISRASNRLIVFGESTENFGALSQITRAEFVSIVVRGLGLLPNNAKQTFEDVDNQSLYAEDIAIASMLGLVNGKQPGKFDPDGTISRQEMAVVLYRALVLSKEAGNVQGSVLDRFHDKEQFSAYAKDAIEQIVSQNIMNGVSSTRFDPEGKVTKAQAVVAIMRLLDKVES